MADLRASFISDSTEQSVRLKGMLVRLEREPDADDVWAALRDFFAYVRTMAPFVGFLRCARLADAGYAVTRDGKKPIGLLPDLLECFTRIGKIVSSSALLRREPAGDDSDVTTVFAGIAADIAHKKDIPAALLKVAKQLSVKEQKMAAKVAELDAREAKCALLEQRDEDSRTSLADKEKQLNDLQERLNALQVEVDKGAADLATKKAELQAKQQAVVLAEQENQVCSEGLFRQEKELREMREALEERKNELNGLQSDLEQKEAVLSSRIAEVQNADDVQQKLKAELALKEDALVSLESEMQRAEKELSGKLSETEALKDNLIEKLRKNEASMRQNNADMENMRETVDGLQKMTVVLQEKYAEKMRHSAELSSALKEVGDRVVRYEAEAADQQENLKTLTQERNRLRTALEQAKKATSVLKEQADFLSELSLRGDCLHEQLLALIRAEKELPPTISETLTPLSQTLKELVLKYTQVSVRKMMSTVCDAAQENAFAAGLKIDFVRDVADKATADAGITSCVGEVLTILLENAARYAVPVGDGARVDVRCVYEGGLLVFSVENKASFDMTAWRERLTESGRVTADLSDEEAVSYLLSDVVSGTSDERGLSSAAKKIQSIGGIADIVVLDGIFRVSFRVPPTLLFTPALIFSVGSTTFAAPLFQVEETKPFALVKTDVSETENGRKLRWRGLMLPLVDISDVLGDSTADEDDDFIIVVRSGVFCFAMRVSQVVTTDEIAGLMPSDTLIKHPVSPLSIVSAESRVLPLIDFSAVTRLLPVALPTADTLTGTVVETDVKTRSFLIYKTSPEEYQAIGVEDVSCIEDFADFPVTGKGDEAKIVYRGMSLPVRDSAKSRDFFFARSLLILKNASGEYSALAIQEVIDIIEIPQDEAPSDRVFYRGKTLPVVQVR